MGRLSRKSIDPFAPRAAQYARFRPVYPKSLLDHVLQVTSGRSRAVDLCCGSAQLLQDLQPLFKRVIGVDRSAAQINKAPAFRNCTYVIDGAVEGLRALQAESVDLITIAQAMHWLDTNSTRELMKEANRVLVDDGSLAVVGYGICRPISPVHRAHFSAFYKSIASFWEKDCDRGALDRGMADLIVHPLHRLEHKWFPTRMKLPRDRFLNYIGTWTALVKQRSHFEIFADTFAVDDPVINVEFPFFALTAAKSRS